MLASTKQVRKIVHDTLGASMLADKAADPSIRLLRVPLTGNISESAALVEWALREQGFTNPVKVTGSENEGYAYLRIRAAFVKD